MRQLQNLAGLAVCNLELAHFPVIGEAGLVDPNSLGGQVNRAGGAN